MPKILVADRYQYGDIGQPILNIVALLTSSLKISEYFFGLGSLIIQSGCPAKTSGTYDKMIEADAKHFCDFLKL